MRFTFYFLLACSLSLTTAAQRLRTFARHQTQRDSVQTEAALRASQVRGQLHWIEDSVNRRRMLFTVEEDGSFAYRAPLNLQAAITTRAADLQEPAGGLRLLGSGIECGVWDDGFVASHVEFGNRILSKEGTSPANHATHVTGTILAAGVNAPARGMAPQANAFTYLFDNDLSEMAALASSDEGMLLFSNHSYGTVTGWSRPNGVWTWYGDPSVSSEEDYRHGFYTSRAQRIDELAFAAPYLSIIWAAGNDRFESGDGTRPADCNGGTGYDCIIPDATAKNVITVGAVPKVLEYTGPASVPMSWFSSWGPTDDGRIKPDLVAAGVDVLSTSAHGTNTYEYSTGTSMATPNVTGSLMLLQELWGKLNAGRHLRASSIKALAIHTAREAGTKPGPDYQFGWGLLDVKAAADVVMKRDFDESQVLERTLQTGETQEWMLQPKENTKVTVTLCWTDPEGAVPSPSLDPLARAIVNDLDVRLIDEDGVVHSPWILNPSVPQAQASTGDNARDNVEKIELETPRDKQYTVVVRHKGQLLNNAQDFSLVITYTARASAAQTWYWVGGTGNWHDESHWSFTSGGPAGGDVPDASDIVIFDSNSLTEDATVSLTANASASRIIWLGATRALLNLNGHVLTVQDQLVLSSPDLSVTGAGFLHFQTASSGVATFNDVNLTNTTVQFAGEWTLNGTMRTHSITLMDARHDWTGASVKSDILRVAAATWILAGADLAVADSLILESTLVEFQSLQAHVTVDTECFFQWNGHYYYGRMSVLPNGVATLAGGGHFSTMEVAGDVRMKSDCTFDTVRLFSAARWHFGNGTSQLVNNQLEFWSSQGQPVELLADASSRVYIPYHEKICTDYLIVRKVDVLGVAVLNAGENSVVEDASGWQQRACHQVLFTDFAVTYPCAGGLTEFTDLSQGFPTSRLWEFEGAAPSLSTSTQTAPAVSFAEAGTAYVSLTLDDGSQSTRYTKEIEVVDNTLPETLIVQTSEGALISLVSAPAYQWYKDGEAIADATAREYLPTMDPGVYQVVLNNGTCTRLSDPYLIAHTGHETPVVDLFPNPAGTLVTIQADALTVMSDYQISDNLGRLVRQANIREPLDVRALSPGLYVVAFTTRAGAAITRKLWVIR